MEYYLAIKRMEALSFVTMQTEMEKSNETQKDKTKTVQLNLHIE